MENLDTTDRRGCDPVGLFGDSGVVPTYINDTVVRGGPPASPPERDKQLLCETGRRRRASDIKAPPLVAAAK